MKLFVVVLCYRVVDLTIDCLRSLSAEIDRVSGAKVGLLENGTGGDSGDRLRKVIEENGWSSWVDLMVVPTNLGFTGGNNLLVRPALESADPPEYVLLLNSDTIVKEPRSMLWSNSWIVIRERESLVASSSGPTGKSGHRPFGF